MSISSRRATAAALALIALFVGGWASIAPHSFYSSFPLPGHHWIEALPAYNEHLTRDVGGLYLALFIASLWSALRPRLESLRLVGASWLGFSVPHLAFHATHLEVFSNVDAVGNVLTLGAAVFLPALLLWPAGRDNTIDEQRAR